MTNREKLLKARLDRVEAKLTACRYALDEMTGFVAARMARRIDPTVAARIAVRLRKYLLSRGRLRLLAGLRHEKQEEAK